MAARPVKIAFLADTADLRANLKKAEDSMESAAAQARTAGERIDSSFDSTAESADQVASKGAQAAGALSGLGDLAGGKFGAAMMTAGVAMQAFADAGDLVNVVTESNIVRKIKDTAVTAAQKAATIASTVATKGMAAAQRVLNLVMRANPIGLVITALLLLGAGLVVAYKKSETFRSIVNGAFTAVKKVVSSVGDAFKGVWDSVSKWLGKAWDFISGLPGKIKGAFSGLWTGLAGGLKSAINAVLHLPLTIPRINTHIPGVGTVGGQTLIPALAKGGIVTSPTLAMIGEAGPEAVVPLSRAGGFGGNTYITLNVTAPVGSNGADIGRQIQKYLDEYTRSGGRRKAL